MHGDGSAIAVSVRRRAGYLGAYDIALASINGTYGDAQFVAGWDRGILPLDTGDFDVAQKYLRPLLRAGYERPILLHTFGIKDPPEQHFSRSMTKWRAIKNELVAGGI